MSDLISRSALLGELRDFKDMDCPSGHTITADYMIEYVENAPAVDAEVVRHGKYGFVGMDMMAGTKAFYFGTCSECRERINFESKHKNYCPNCGAKMEAAVKMEVE